MKSRRKDWRKRSTKHSRMVDMHREIILRAAVECLKRDFTISPVERIVREAIYRRAAALAATETGRAMP